MEEFLTDRKFWSDYWESKPDLIKEIKRDYELGALVSRVIKDRKIDTAIELGGFPGYYAVWLKKHFNIKSALLDYFIHEDLVHELSSVNQVKKGDIEIIEADLFNYIPHKQYDFVLSCGLIEHFENTKDIIERHVQFLKPGGTLLITIPNFTGINGWVQRKFDMENFQKHNIRSMDPGLLLSIAKELNLTKVRSTYYGKFSVWLENKDTKPVLTKAFVKLIWIAGKLVTKTLGFDSKQLSPYIVLEAIKPL